MRREPGVVRTSVAHDTKAPDIVAEALRDVAGSNLPISLIDHSFSAHHVAWWHRRFFGTPPTVILRASASGNAGDAHAGALASAGRTLADSHGMRVIVDASHVSLFMAVEANRRLTLQVEPMPRDLIEALDGMGELHAALKAAGVADAVWAVAGGHPAQYNKLLEQWNAAGRGDITTVAGDFVASLLRAAISDCAIMVDEHPRLAPLYDMFAAEDTVLVSVPVMAMIHPAPPTAGGVLRKILGALPDGGGHASMFVPATPAMGLVLRHKLKEVPSMRDLAAMAAAAGPAAPPATLA